MALLASRPPAALGRLNNLRALSLRSNRVLETIPNDVLQLPGLEALFLQHNLLSGPIPPGIQRLGGLERLVLSCNNLSGPIPFALNSLTALRVLRLDGNRLSGAFPASASRVSAPSTSPTTTSTAPSPNRSRTSRGNPSSGTSSSAGTCFRPVAARSFPSAVARRARPRAGLIQEAEALRGHNRGHRRGRRSGGAPPPHRHRALRGVQTSWRRRPRHPRQPGGSPHRRPTWAAS
ncbi:hypothetical protein ZEAMMB73_Zm00001d047278 [Zea mays]|uniref:Uncharacterized protein n=1 Tax=Zea mays TaxID=4577 RepID=A0A1D6P896_MAIZE|nr:hypothetical protein ZEAMMB73_Zm00001d047278 [Zea mays]